jgi:hypothetical protein
MVPFTNNYTDRSTEDGYQFEFFCQRCGNGYASTFEKTVAGFGGRLLSMGGGLLGGSVGDTVEELGRDAGSMQTGTAHEKHFAKAVAQIQPYFGQCHRCGQWVCGNVCWNTQFGLCATCAPRLDQEVAGMQAAAQVNQLNDRIQQVDWTRGVQYQEQATGLCASCRGESGGGRFCQHCGAPQASAPEARRFCGGCGTQIAPGVMFCTHCGTPAT